LKLNEPQIILFMNVQSQNDNPEIEHAIRDFIARNLLYSDTGFTYADDTSFLKQGIIDSLGVVELVEFVQTTFGIKVNQQDVTPAHFDSVAALAAFVREKRNISSLAT
jgi:acyl carrier protein